jgi:hypothetical protein
VPIIAYANPIHVGLAGKCNAGRGPRGTGEKLDCGADALLISTLQGA